MKPITALAYKFDRILKTADTTNIFKTKENTNTGTSYTERTEEIDDLIKDSLNLIILMQRSFQDMHKSCSSSHGEAKELGSKLAKESLFELQEIETALEDPKLLEFDRAEEWGALNNISGSIMMLENTLNLIKPIGDQHSPIFKHIDLRIYKWLNELSDNIDKLQDKAVDNAPFMEQHLYTQPKRMLEQDPKNIEEVSSEDLHPDFEYSDL